MITTTSSAVYMSDKENAIPPAYVDDMPYESWVEPGSTFSDKDTIEMYRSPFYQLKATVTGTWSLLSGTLPPGLSLSPDGKIAGTPTAPGEFNFTAKIDYGAGSFTKSMSMLAKPQRAEWFRKALFGICIHWGRFVPTKITYVTGTAEFEARATEFNADQWADKLVSWGAKFIHFSAVFQDSYRNWPSTTPTRLNLRSDRDFTGEIIAACHARGIKVIVYFPGEYWSNKDIPGVTDGSLATNAWGSMNNGLLKELVLKGIDGVWFDTGAASDIYPGVNKNNVYWAYLIPMMRYQNPDLIFGVNPGTGKGGAQARFPYSDFVIYEGRKSSSSNSSILETAVPLLSRKKMAIDVLNMVGNTFAFPETLDFIQPVEDLIENIKRNWAVGATVTLALPVQASGKLLHEYFAPTFEAVGAFVALNKNVSVEPQIIVSDQNLLRFNQPVSSRVYYTLDGSEPTINSNIYLSPIPINKNTVIKAMTIEPSKLPSVVAAERVERLTVSLPNLISLLPSGGGGTSVIDEKQYHRGMTFAVKSSSLMLYKIGRKVAGAPITQDHDIIIRRFFDTYPILLGKISANAPVENGYQYATIPPIRLEAGMYYIITSKENNVDSYASNTFASLPMVSSEVRLGTKYILSVNGDKEPVVQDANGQILDLKYTILETSNDLALGRPVQFLRNDNNAVLGTSGTSYPENAVDNNLISVAAAGGQYAYTLVLDLEKPMKINEINIMFGKGFATSFNVYTSLNKTTLNMVAQRENNLIKNIKVNFPTTLARYVHVRALLPNNAGQLGSQMNVSALNVYHNG